MKVKPIKMNCQKDKLKLKGFVLTQREASFSNDAAKKIPNSMHITSFPKLQGWIDWL